MVLHTAIDLRTDALPHALLRPRHIQLLPFPRILLVLREQFIVVAVGIATQALACSNPRQKYLSGIYIFICYSSLPLSLSIQVLCYIFSSIYSGLVSLYVRMSPPSSTELVSTPFPLSLSLPAFHSLKFFKTFHAILNFKPFRFYLYKTCPRVLYQGPR